MINWTKQNKLAAVVIGILFILLFKNDLAPLTTTRYSTPAYRGVTSDMAAPAANMESYNKSLPVSGGGEYAPSTQKDRLVVQESSLSLVVKNVRETSDKIVEFAKQNDGFMVNESFNNPEEAPYASVAVRVPSTKLQQVLIYYRGLALKVSSENLLGTDVTDQYVDINARLETLNKTKAKFEDIMSKAITVQDLLNVQRELISLQDQIDALKGQAQYLEKTAQLAKVTIYLSTDEFSLPYAPAQTFRPEVILKQAVRSLVLTLRSLMEKLIWIAVFSILWVPTLVIAYLVYRWHKKRQIVNRAN